MAHMRMEKAYINVLFGGRIQDPPTVIIMPKSSKVAPENTTAAPRQNSNNKSATTSETGKTGGGGGKGFKASKTASRFASVDKIIPEFSAGMETPSWADACDNNNGGGDVKKPFNKDEAEEVNMLLLQNGEAPFLVGVKGRNISLIRKFSGMAIYIKNNMVSMIPQRPNASAEMAWRMVLSACFGGILRWFDTPHATKKGYPDDRIEEFEAMAAIHDASIDLLRSKRGHMCLMLIPQLSVKEKPSDSEIDSVKAKIVAARHSLLEILQPSAPELAVEP